MRAEAGGVASIEHKAVKGKAGARADRVLELHTALMQACARGDAKRAAVVLGLLLGSGGSVNQTEEHGRTPLFIACEYGHTGTAEVLLDKGADIHQATKDGSTPLYVACHQGHTGTAELLLDKGAHIHQTAKNGCTPLYIACHQDHTGTAELLLGKGADIH